MRRLLEMYHDAVTDAHLDRYSTKSFSTLIRNMVFLCKKKENERERERETDREEEGERERERERVIERGREKTGCHKHT